LSPRTSTESNFRRPERAAAFKAEAKVVRSWCRGEDEVAVVDVALRLALDPDLARRLERDLTGEDPVARLTIQWKRLDVAEILRLIRRRTPHLRVYDCRGVSQLGPRPERIVPA
jgi:hypothetical protein